MAKRFGLVVSVLFLALQSSLAFAEETTQSSSTLAEDATLNGLWTTASGTVYRFIQIEDRVSATYETLNAAQIAAGIQKGDLALKGTYVDNVLSATYYQRAPLPIQEICPEHQIIDGPIEWELNNNVLTGTLLLVFGSDDQCRITRRALLQVRIEHTPGQQIVISAPVADGMPLPWPFPW